ncbi:MAG: YraN family protein [Pseudomonadota bacterium]
MARRGRLTRQAAERRGRQAEAVAALWLRLKAYRIMTQRVKTPVGEIDLIARRGRVLAFIEVKQRRTHGEAMMAVPDQGWQRIAAAAQSWSAGQPHAVHSLNWRYDLMTVSSRFHPRHHIDYWRP